MTIYRVQFDPESGLARMLNNDSVPRAKRFAPVLFHAQVEGAWYVSFREEAVKEQIDRVLTGRSPVRAVEGAAAAAPPPERPAGASDTLYVAPKAEVQAREGLGFFLEWESHKRALANAPLWQVLFRCGVLPADATGRAMREAALDYFGSVPLAPDGSAYRYDPRTDEVMNERHGSRREPVLHAGLDADSPLGRLLEDLRSLRADLRFTEDGVQTAVTIERQGPR